MPRGEIIHIILGTDLAYYTRSEVELHMLPDDPIARRTPLGWTAFGRAKDKAVGVVGKENNQ
jgi:hypothetical protein